MSRPDGNGGKAAGGPALLRKASRLVAAREYAEAARVFKSARLGDAVFSALCGEALCLYKMGRLPEALDLAEQAARIRPERGEPHFLSGLAEKDAGRYDKSCRSLTEALGLGFRRASALYHRGAAHFLAGRLAQAEDDFAEAAKEKPAGTAAFYNLGVVRVHRSRWQAAAEAFSRCARLDPAGAPHYHDIIFGIGRAQASEEFHFRGHRIKNMLALLADTCQRRSRETDRPQPLDDGFETLAGRLKRVLAEMSELLSFVKREPLELDVWDIHDVIQTALLSAGDGVLNIDVKKEFAAVVPGVVCDAHGLSEAFLNIILNASEAMGDGGTLTVRTRWDGKNKVRVEFEDTGGGIQAQPPEKVFQFAFTTKPGGNGLGLCQASRAVEEHGGTILVEEGARGALFAIELPLRAALGESIHDIGLRPELSEELGLLWPEGENRLLRVTADT